MSNSKKIILSLPEELLDRVDDCLKAENKNRSEWVREAIVHYLAEGEKTRIRVQMEQGYREMGMLNLKLSEEGLAEDEEDLAVYENILLESE
ncbi:CopG family ribbon-helix-helix protein [Bacilliculturomica massiliensis]|uniref:CopG family ribbon-helix-helix protein n=1 Tax=Bacilliculturomica massiliensis TaxID=1917867 RepID=UPI001030DE4F|nr:ribbon-helix-helix protein, CopG family [Bacilliculturomica massiliensis]